jgi:putative GTP pyrophosphokinase
VENGPDLERGYEAHCVPLHDLGPVVQRLLQELLRAAEIRPHSVRYRIKSKESVQRKVGRKDASYRTLRDVHDILGLRIITFFPDEVDDVARVIEDEFDIDDENSVDKRSALDPDRFGYLSLHYVASLNGDRAQLTEHARFEDLCFEIQIRSILQHAWAEIEHDLGYQGAAAIPPSMRRRFSRLAGLLEIADDEFQALRNDVSEYQSGIDEDVLRDPGSVEIDQDSVAAVIRADAVIQELDAFVAAALKESLSPDPDITAGSLAVELRWLGLRTIADVQGSIRQRHRQIREFVNLWARRVTPSPSSQVYAGISLFYLAYIVVSEAKSIDKVIAYLEAGSIGPEDESERRQVAERVLGTHEEIDAGKGEQEPPA